ncbi:MAG: thioredoxin [Lachnospiraceae bacterium]|jgi:hypothetical protein|nr:thioredoxin [Lachnospiraceae bacterium]
MKKYRKSIQIAVLAMAVGMIAIGIRMEEFRDVLYKAVMICMECIGIG